MPTLYIDKKGIELSYEAGALVFSENGKRKQSIPVAPIDRVVIHGDINIRANVLGSLGKAGIGVVILSGRIHEPALFLPKPHSDAEHRLAQFKAALDRDFALSFSKKLVLTKVKAQKEFLEELCEKTVQKHELLKSISTISDVSYKVVGTESIPSLLGLEGCASAAYFSGIASVMAPSLKFYGRNRRPPKDPLNAILSLGYTLLHAEAVNALYMAGLDPFVGFYHQLDYGRESLACDIVEKQRVTVDRFAIDCFKNKILRVEDFSASGDACILGKAGRMRFYEAYEPVCLRFRRCFEKETQDLVKLFTSRSVDQNAEPCSNDLTA